MSLQAGVRPNVRTYTALITALGNAKQWKRELHTLQRLKTDMSANRVEPNAYTYSALLKTMGEHGQWALAEQVCFQTCIMGYPMLVKYELQPVIVKTL